ncbi:hypothetical protein M441DRAFT_455123 [Trichoderma asperellum CBS 433.97]|uniref:Uncharacterized protein n=1 Tax=Trichoderma asperellum (strain ATCC 204424 / CBS 433.97 / NBRC 101777) TaxID=1042311 RepID=A0A2T3ZEI4_TRIA4|nr:hypothetical protein M441DRAFT_455123 [Trichoderma asperellum CBS 433.97]PTB43218.1 hypothetical protein M441DRAFT_455123 [Trichoderma asperellum CBS 433.97]
MCWLPPKGETRHDWNSYQTPSLLVCFLMNPDHTPAVTKVISMPCSCFLAAPVVLGRAVAALLPIVMCGMVAWRLSP